MNHFLSVSLLMLICIKYCVCCPINGLIWNSTAEEFVLISSINMFLQIHNMNGKTCQSEDRDLENFNISGTVIRVSGNEQRDIVMFYEEDTKITGIFGDVWTLLSEYLNFEMALTKLENSAFVVTQTNYGNIMNYDYMHTNSTDILLAVHVFAIRWEHMDFTEPIYKQYYRLYTQRLSKINKTWLFQLFNWQVWLLILIIFIIFTCISYFVQKLSSRISKTSKENFPPKDHLFYNFAKICNQGYVPYDFERSRILGISISLFSSLILIAYSSQLISRMTQTSFVPPFVNLETLYADTKYNVIALENSIAHNAFQLRKKNIYCWMLDKRRITFISDSVANSDLACSGSKKIAILKANDVLLSGNCKVEPVGEKYYEAWMAAGLPKGHKYRRIFNSGIQKLREWGLLDVLTDRWIRPQFIEYNNFEFISVTMYHVEIIFLILAYGIVLSLIILVIENVMFLAKYW